jgi:hypothetical protein
MLGQIEAKLQAAIKVGTEQGGRGPAQIKAAGR